MMNTEGARAMKELAERAIAEQKEISQERMQLLNTKGAFACYGAAVNDAAALATAYLALLQRHERLREAGEEVATEGRRLGMVAWRWGGLHRPRHRRCQWCDALAKTEAYDAPIPHTENCLLTKIAAWDAVAGEGRTDA